MKNIRKLAISLLVLALLIGVVYAAPTVRGTDTTSETQSSATENVPTSNSTQATPFSIGMRVTVRPGATYWEGASDLGYGRHGTFSENNIYLSGKETFINGITVVDKDGSPRNTVFMTRDSVLLDGNRWSYSLGSTVGQVMVHICVPNFVPGDLGWVSVKDIDPYMDPSSGGDKTPDETKPETTATAVADTTAADNGSTDGSNQGHCKWLWLLLPLLLLLALLLWLFWRRKTLTTAEAVGLIMSKNPAAALLDCSGSVSEHSGEIASYAKSLHGISTFIIFAMGAIVTSPGLFQEFSTEVGDSATDIFNALNYLDRKIQYKQVIVVTDGENNCETPLESRDNVKKVIFLTPNDPAVFPRSTIEQVQGSLTKKVAIKKLQD